MAKWPGRESQRRSGEKSTSDELVSASARKRAGETLPSYFLLPRRFCQEAKCTTIAFRPPFEMLAALRGHLPTNEAFQHFFPAGSMDNAFKSVVPIT